MTYLLTLVPNVASVAGSAAGAMITAANGNTGVAALLTAIMLGVAGVAVWSIGKTAFSSDAVEAIEA